jgi:hypothetical protein
MGGGTILGRAIALALSARGVRIVVAGRDEKALGVTVGEVVHGGGKARHLAGDPGDPMHLAAALERATSVFGVPEIAIVADASGADVTLRELVKRLGSPGRVLVALAAPAPDVVLLVQELALSSAGEPLTCNAILVEPASEEDAADDAAELAVYLCSRAGDRIRGQVVTLGR